MPDLPLDRLAAICGPAQVLTGSDAAPYGQSWVKSYSAQPGAVVRPGSTEEVAAIMRLAQDTRTPIVPMGGNTGVTGATQACDAVILSTERMNRIREIRSHARVAVAEAGVVVATLQEAVAAQGLSFPLMFGARGSARIGGVLSTNAGGANVLRYGNTRALCLGLEAVLPDGRVMDLTSALLKDNSGYDLRQLLIGAEGTLGVITAAVLKLFPTPVAYATAMVGMSSLDGALDLLNRLQSESSGAVEAFEIMPQSYFARLRETRPGLNAPLDGDHAFTLLIELGATARRDAVPDADGTVPVVALLEETLGHALERGQIADAVVARSDAQRKELWHLREIAAEITLDRAPLVDTDIAVPPDQVGAALAGLEARLGAMDAGAYSVTVGHLGDGNLHYTMFPTRDDATHLDALREMVEDVVAEFGGSFSAEHGVGRSKLPSMRRRKDPVALDMMRAIKTAIDPQGVMNPGVLLP
ncbi:MAG: FAD-binding oxidoreductase [Celeribacter sp.]